MLSRFTTRLLSVRRPVPLTTSSLALSNRAYSTERIPEYQASSLLKSAAAVVISGALLLAYFQHEKQQAALAREATKKQNEAAGMHVQWWLMKGRPLVGGAFELVGVDGKTVTDQDFLGRFSLVYFGYSFCPDVCPEELEKMAEAVDTLEKEGFTNIVPLFVSVDPKRDTLAVIKDYLLEFSPKFVGLTGTPAQIKKIAKAYRIYYSAPPKSIDNDTDYLVDHSIFFFLMGPQGEYLCHFGKIDTAQQVADKIKSYMANQKPY